MIRYALVFIIFISVSNLASAQSSNEKILIIIDSLPLIDNPEQWNQVLQEDIADMNIIKSRDSLKMLGWKKMDAVAYIFTKEYRKRPDSLKKIPSLKQMKINEDRWNFHDFPYTGRYIDYYNNGKIQNEGFLAGGKLNGQLTIYFKKGKLKSITNYKDGIPDGFANDYYTNGALQQSREYIDGKIKLLNLYFPNGSVQNEIKLKKETGYDTAFSYYSTGEVKQMKLIKDGAVAYNKIENDLNFYTDQFNQALNGGDLKAAKKHLSKINKIDSTSPDTYFKKGIVLFTEFRFEEAIIVFDKALQIEPLMRQSLAYRAISRVKKYKFINTTTAAKENKGAPLTLEDVISMPASEQEKVCQDVQQAGLLEYSEYFFSKLFPNGILDYCSKELSP